MIVKELKPLHDRAKSFYKKAKVQTMQDGTTELKSYNTIILKLDNNGNITRNADTDNYTNTTLRHVKEFLKQFTNLKLETKKQILKNIKEF